MLSASGVRVDDASWSLARTSTARALVAPDGAAHYEFQVEWRLEPPALGGARLVHVGSLGAFLAPGADALVAFIDRLDTDTVVTFDPNIRPALLDSRDATRARVLHLAARADLVKLSIEDAAWLWPGLSPESVVALLLDAGVSLVAITLGGEGALAATRGVRVLVAAPAVPVVDTVGAGDAFMAALVHRVLGDPGLLKATTHVQLEDAIRFAVDAAAVTVQRPGADPPTAAEVAEARRGEEPAIRVGGALADPVRLYAAFTAKGGEADRVAGLLDYYAELVRSEPGNVLFEAGRTIGSPERFVVYEEYRDQAAFEQHLHHAAGRAFNAALKPLIVEPAATLTFVRGLTDAETALNDTEDDR